MTLELYQMILLIFAGAMVGISMSFIGQTGAGIVIPIVLLITGDALLAISINILNDLIAIAIVLIFYIKNRNFHWNKDYFYFLLFSILTSLFCVILLMLTDLGSAFGWLLPIVFLVIGFSIFKKGFPTAESVKRTAHSIAERLLKNRESEEEIKEMEERMDEQIKENASGDIIEGLIPIGSKLYYYVFIIIGIFLGVNSGLFGSAGAFILAVVLVLFGYPLKKAVGTGLMVSMIICLSTYAIFQIFGMTFKSRYYFDWEITLFLTIGTIITAFITSMYVQKLSAKVMGRAMGVIMILLGTASLIVFFMI